MKKLLLIATIVVSLGGGFFTALRVLSRLPSGPLPVVWDKESCGHCHMHVGEPRFAAQLQTTTGEVLNFDDPGCLLYYRAKQNPGVHAMYFHHVYEDRWLEMEQVGFVAVDSSPMGYNFGAVGKEVPNAIPLQVAEQKILAKGTPR